MDNIESYMRKAFNKGISLDKLLEEAASAANTIKAEAEAKTKREQAYEKGPTAFEGLIERITNNTYTQEDINILTICLCLRLKTIKTTDIDLISDILNLYNIF